jgi:hypothetical protein
MISSSIHCIKTRRSRSQGRFLRKHGTLYSSLDDYDPILHEYGNNSNPLMHDSMIEDSPVMDDPIVEDSDSLERNMELDEPEPGILSEFKRKKMQRYKHRGIQKSPGHNAQTAARSIAASKSLVQSGVHSVTTGTLSLVSTSYFSLKWAIGSIIAFILHPAVLSCLMGAGSVASIATHGIAGFLHILSMIAFAVFAFGKFWIKATYRLSVVLSNFVTQFIGI